MIELADWPGIAACFDYQLGPEIALRRFSHLDYCLLLHSSQQHAGLGRYSFLVADPVDRLELPIGAQAPFEQLRKLSVLPQQQTIAQLPPFQGGLAGLLGYELNQSLENLPITQRREVDMPVLAFGLFDVVLAWDHIQQQAFVISQGIPETDFKARQNRARSRLEEFQSILSDESPSRRSNQVPLHCEDAPALYAPFACPQAKNVTSNFDESRFLEMIERGIEYIFAGDVYQVNLAQRLIVSSNIKPIELFEKLCQCNPAPFAGWFDLGSQQIISCSPERLVNVSNGKVETRPIKGTRRRTRIPQVDIEAKRELEISKKDRAENVMIVDLMRNDLSRVCRDDSIKVRQFLQTEAYESVLHLVSSVEGSLRSDRDVFDLLQATFPGGSVTGAPKIRAMEIISELEQTARGAYCGSLGYIGLNGDADFNILIRTITAANGCLQIPVGGGVVSHSDPASEYQETWVKAAGLLQACVEKNDLPSTVQDKRD